MKKLALVLALCLVVQCLGVTAFADVSAELVDSATPDVGLVVEPVADPAQEPVVEPVQEPAQEPVVELVQEPAQEPVVEPVQEPAPEIVEESVQEPAQEPVVEPVQEPVQEPVVEPVQEPVQEPVVEPSVEPAQEPVAEPVENPEPVADPVPASPLREVAEGAVLYADGACTEAAVTLAGKAVVLLVEDKGAVSAIRYAVQGEEGLEAVSGYVKNEDLAEVENYTPQGETIEADGFALMAVKAAEEETPAVEDIPVAEETPSEEVTPVVEAVPAEEVIPAEETVPAVEDIPEEEVAPAVGQLKAQAPVVIEEEKTEEKVEEEEKAAEEKKDEAAPVEFVEEPERLEGSQNVDKDYRIDDKGRIYQYNGTDTIISIPDTIQGKTVTGLLDTAFARNTQIVAITLPSSLNRVDEGAFEQCTSLKSVNLPNTITVVGPHAFDGCTALESVSWSQVVTIGHHAFNNCTALPGINLPDTVKTIEDNAFQGCTSAVKLILPNGLESIGASAFSGCNKLDGIYLPDSVKSVGNSAFENCVSAKVLSLPSGLSGEGFEIKNFTFKGCTGLTDLIITTPVAKIGRQAFADCTGLRWIYLPQNVNEVGIDCFQNVPAECYIVVENANAYLGTDALGNAATIYGWATSTTKTYANSHTAMPFRSFELYLFVMRCRNTFWNSGLTRTSIKTIVPDAERLAKNETNGAGYVKEFLSSATYINRKRTDTQVIGDLYTAMMMRATPGPSAAETAYWMERLDNGVSYDFVLNNVAASDEFKALCTNRYLIQAGSIPYTENRDRSYEVTLYVVRMYKIILQRPGVRTWDVNGLNYWTGVLLDRNSTAAEVIGGFVRSDEYKNLLKNGMTTTQEIEHLYETMMGREPDAGGIAYWKQFLDVGMTIQYVINGFARSDEFTAICKKAEITPGSLILSEARDQNYGVTAFASRCYTECLNRSFDADGLNHWAQVLLSKSQTAQQVAHSFVFSEEYTKKGATNYQFVVMLYGLFMNRHPDGSGAGVVTDKDIAYWTGRLVGGATRETICNEFGASDEFSKIVASFGL